VKLPSEPTKTVGPWIVFPSHVLSSVGSPAVVPPGSAHSSTLIVCPGVNVVLALTDTEMTCWSG
jgi:hypothetical protein